MSLYTPLAKENNLGSFEVVVYIQQPLTHINYSRCSHSNSRDTQFSVNLSAKEMFKEIQSSRPGNINACFVYTEVCKEHFNIINCKTDVRVDSK